MTRTNVRKISYNIGDVDYVITLLAQASAATTFDYVRELLDNICDDFWVLDSAKRRAEYVATITIDRKLNRLLVSDNAHGIVSERLDQIPTEIGGSLEGKRALALAAVGDSSRKGRIAQMRGMNQVGIHAWEINGMMCLVTSRSDKPGSDGKTHYLLMAKEADGRKMIPETGEVTPPRSKFGTDVEIADIDPKRMNQINVKRLEAFLAQEYRKDLTSDTTKFTIEIVEIDKFGKKKPTIYVSPVLVVVNNFTLGDGRTEKCMQWNSHGVGHREFITWTGGALPNRKDGRCRIWWGNRRVYNDVTEIEGFDHAPWNTGRLDMDIQADFCIPGPKKRDEFIDDPEGRFSALKKGLRELEKPLNEFLGEIDERVSKPIDDGVTKKLRNLVVDAFAESGFELDGVPRRLRPKIGGSEEMNVGLKNGKRKFGSKPTKNGTGSSNDSNPLAGLLDTRDTKPVDPNKPKVTASKRARFEVINWPMEDLPDRAVVEEDEQGRIQFIKLNSVHPDYVRFVEPDPRGLEARRYKIDQLISCILSKYFSDELRVSEIVSVFDNLRFAAYVRGGLLVKR